MHVMGIQITMTHVPCRTTRDNGDDGYSLQKVIRYRGCSSAPTLNNKKMGIHKLLCRFRSAVSSSFV